jgi:deoxyribodipyrimidine photo-lyase
MAPATPIKPNNLPKILIYLLRRDLRLADNPILDQISRSFSSPSPPFTHLLPIYIFAADQIEVSGFLAPPPPPPASAAVSDIALAAAAPTSPFPEARSRVAGFWRCGPHRAKFLAESVWELKQSLESTGSGLCVRFGRVADVVRDVLAFYEAGAGASGSVTGVWMAADETSEEKRQEEKVRKMVEKDGKEFRLFKDEKYFVDE